jgi:uncharacterized membrane protein
MEETRLPPPNPSTPFSPEQEIRQLREIVTSLSAQITHLESRLASIEQSRALPNAGPLPELKAQAKLQSPFGLKMVNRAGALTLAIGIVFFFKYAADNKWIGPEARVAIGVVAGLGMLVAAEWMRRRQPRDATQILDQNVFIQGIAGCGLATIYVSLYACFAFYGLIIPLAGWSFLVLVSAFAIWISIRYASAAIAALGFTGALLTAMLLHNKATAWWFDLLYLLLLGATTLAIAIHQRWPVLIPGLAVLIALAATILLYSPHPVGFASLLIALAIIHFSAARRVRDDQRVSSIVYLTAHGYLLVACVRAVALWASQDSAPEDRSSFISALESVLLAIYGTAALITGLVRKSSPDRSLGLVLLGIVITKLYVWDVWQLNRFYRISAFVLLGILLLTASYLYSRFRNRTS